MKTMPNVSVELAKTNPRCKKITQGLSDDYRTCELFVDTVASVLYRNDATAFSAKDNGDRLATVTAQ